MPDHSSSTPSDRVGARGPREVVRWLRDSLPRLRPRADQEPPRIREAGWRVQKGMDRFAPQDDTNPYAHYRDVKEALQRANLAFAASVGANASRRAQERLARRVSRLQVQEDEAVLAMRRQDRSWGRSGFMGVFRHSEGSAG